MLATNLMLGAVLMTVAVPTVTETAETIAPANNETVVPLMSSQVTSSTASQASDQATTKMCLISKRSVLVKLY